MISHWTREPPIKVSNDYFNYDCDFHCNFIMILGISKAQHIINGNVVDTVIYEFAKMFQSIGSFLRLFTFDQLTGAL